MKKAILRALPLLLAFVLLLASCAGSTDVWANATYTEDTELGEGATTVTVTVTAEEKKVTFTLHTDKTNLADAMLEANLCSGDEGNYGLYITHVNGIRADYDLDGGYYWSIAVGGETAMSGASDILILPGVSYEFTRTK